MFCCLPRSCFFFPSLSFFLEFAAFSWTQNRPRLGKQNCKVLPPWKAKSYKILHSIYIALFFPPFLSLPVLPRVKPRWRRSAREGWFTDILLLPSKTLPSCLLLFEFRPRLPVFPPLHPSIPWQHELPLSVTVTWASAGPHITALFDWPGPFQVGEPLPDNNLVWLLEQRCNWLICSPCLGLRLLK